MDHVTLVLIAGLVIGLCLGALSRWSFFCTFGAIADLFIMGDHRRARGWALAMAVAIAGTQALHMLGWIDLGEVFYLSPRFGWAGAIVGGFCFGLGMSLVGTCSYGSLIRLGSGDLKSLLVMLVIGITAYMTLHGPLALLRVEVIGALDVTFETVGSQGLPELLSASLSLEVGILRLLLVAATVLALLTYCFGNRRFQRQTATVIGGAGIGVMVVAAWFATGVIGSDEFDPVRLQALSFVRPVGDGLMYLMTSTGSHLNFGILTVAGVVTGALAVSLLRGEFAIESFDSDKQMLRHIAGAALMGFGGVTALGCTIGQGISAISALALSAPIALAFIALGAYVGLQILLNGAPQAWKIFGRQPRGDDLTAARD